MSEYIEREERVKASCERCNGEYVPCDKEHCILMEVIHSIPAADVRPVVRGKWVEHNYDPEYLSCDFSCSECNVYLEEYYFGEGQWPGKTDHYFCPNCGARMVPEDDEA